MLSIEMSQRSLSPTENSRQAALEHYNIENVETLCFTAAGISAVFESKNRAKVIFPFLQFIRKNTAACL